MVQEQDAKRPKEVAELAAVGNVQPEDDVMVRVEFLHCLQKSR
jgi:hypothetical protein